MTISEEPPLKKRQIDPSRFERLICRTEWDVDSVRELIELFNALEVDAVRKSVLPLVKYDSWINLGARFRASIFENQPKLESLMSKGLKSFNSEDKNVRYFQVAFVANFIEFTIQTLTTSTSAPGLCTACCELVIDLLSQLPTRRCVRPFLVDRLFRERTASSEEPLVSRINYYTDFPINDFTAEMLTPGESAERIESVREKVRTICWASGLEEIGLSSSNVLFGSVPKCEAFYESLSAELVHQILKEALLVDLERGYPDEVLRKVFINRLCQSSVRESTNHGAGGVKQSLQYLSFDDYLERSLRRYEVEAARYVQNAVEEAISAMKQPTGSGRMGLGVERFEVKKISKKSKLLPSSSNSVTAELVVDLKRISDSVRDEWDNETRVDDALILVSLPSVQTVVASLVHMADIQGNVVGPGQLARDVLVGDKRVFTIRFDHSGESSLPTFQVVVRVHDSHFKYMLSNLNRRTSQLPEFISDMILGYGDPADAASASLLLEPLRLQVSRGNEDEPRQLIFSPGQELENNHLWGLCPGLTLMSPADGSASVARIIESLVINNHPTRERVLVLAKRNETIFSTLNQLAAKIVPKEYILRPAGSVDDEFGQYRVINHILKLRLQHLSEVRALAVAMGLGSSADDYAYSCDNAHQMYLNVIGLAWNRYHRLLADIKTGSEKAEDVVAYKLRTGALPGGSRKLSGYDESEKDFKKLAEKLLSKNPPENVLYPFRAVQDGSEFSFESIKQLIEKLEELRPFEVLKTVRERSQYLLSCQARVVAITNTGLCKHLNEFIDSHAQFSTVIVQDASEIMDVETFFALTAQKEPNRNLKRIVLVGDETRGRGSMFERFIKLGVPVYK